MRDLRGFSISEDPGVRGFIAQKNYGTSDESLDCYMRCFGEPVPLERGNIGEVSYEPNSTKVALTRGHVPWHTERINTTRPPSHLMLACIEPPASGGRTLLHDGIAAAHAVLAEDPRLAEVVLRYRKEDEEVEWPLIVEHPFRKEPVLWFRQEHGQPFHSSLAHGPKGMDIHEVHERMDGILARLPVRYAHHWKAGDVLVLDNSCMLHAREAYTGDRKLKRLLANGGWLYRPM